MTTSAEYERRVAGERALWERRAGGPALGELAGWELAALDGAVGEVIAGEEEPGCGYLVAAGGAWIEGRMVMVPAGLIAHVDPRTLTVTLATTRTQVGLAPAFESDRFRDGAYRAELAQYYGPLDV